VDLSAAPSARRPARLKNSPCLSPVPPHELARGPEGGSETRDGSAPALTTLLGNTCRFVPDCRSFRSPRADGGAPFAPAKAAISRCPPRNPPHSRSLARSGPRDRSSPLTARRLSRSQRRGLCLMALHPASIPVVAGARTIDTKDAQLRDRFDLGALRGPQPLKSTRLTFEADVL
jgi:hypothetical protein